jgi:cytoskeletal protein CcmA (bactofilin family)
MRKLTKLFAVFIPAFILLLASAAPVNAVFMKSGTNLVFQEDEKISETAFISGSSITINSDIDGDLLCAGQSVVINGNIKGDILCVAQNIKINGSVDGNVRSVAQTIEVFGKVTRNLMTASQKLVLGPKSSVGGDVIFGVQNVDFNGQIGRDLTGAGDSITISGSLLRNATITGTNISLADTGKIGGNIDYYIAKESTASIAQKNVKGSITKYDIEPKTKPVSEKKIADVSKVGLAAKIVFGIISSIILGLTIVYFDSKGTKKRVEQIMSRPFVSGLIGLTALIIAPIVFFILMFTIVGVPVAFVFILFYILTLITSSLYTSVVFGKVVMTKLFHKKGTLNTQIALGITLLGLVSSIPVIGWTIAFFSFCVGLGASLITMVPKSN